MKKKRTRGNGSIFQRPACETWTIQFYSYNGKRVRESTGTADYQAAQKVLRARLSAMDKGEPVETKKRNAVTCGELYVGLERKYVVNGQRSLDGLGRKWKKLKPMFANRAARAVDGDVLDRYVDERLAAKAAPSSINRELACLKTAMRLGQSKHKYVMPLFPHLAENNVRKGFVEQADFDRLRGCATEPWVRLWLEMAFEYGWRTRELTNLRVRQANATTGLVRLEVGETKCGEGREVAMSKTVREMVKLAVVGKAPGDYLLTRADGTRIKNFRKLWHNLCVRAGLGRWVCRACQTTVTGKKCDCAASALLRGEKLRYIGLIPHDLRRSAARELRRAGVAESTIMSMAGWATASMFRRYAISDPKDIKAAIEKREQAREESRTSMVAEEFAAHEAEAEAEGRGNVN